MKSPFFLWFVRCIIFFILILLLEGASYGLLSRHQEELPFLFSRPMSRQRTYGSANDFRYTYYDFLSDWAHNPANIQLPKGWFWKEAYIENEPLNPKQEAKTLLIYGGSTTDLAYIDVNWPFYLDQLFKEQGLNIKIYIGAVAGIGTSQELLRLIRDIRAIKPQLVISYSGINELDMTVEDHPMLTTFNKRLIRRVIWPRPAALLPNLARLIEKIVKGQLLIQGRTYGKKVVASRAQNWQTHLNWMRLIAESEGAQFVGVLQPNVAVGKPHLIGKEKEIVKGDFAQLYPAFYQEARSFVAKAHHLKDFGEIFAQVNEEIYFDDCHMTEKGNQIIAQKMLDWIEKVPF